MGEMPDDPRWCAVLRLQALLKKHPVGSRKYEIADRAIGLLLNDRRKINEFAARNAWRHAKFVEARRARDAREFESYDDTSPSHGPNDRPGATIVAQIADAEATAIASDLAAKLTETAKKLHPLGQACLRGMVEGLSQTELALRLQVSASQASIQRARVRGAMTHLLAA